MRVSFRVEVVTTGETLPAGCVLGGVILATAVLHAVGLGLGAAAASPRFTKVVRVAGSLVAAAGVGLLAAG